MYYLNTNQPYILFENNLKSKIYVDKSMLIEKISRYIRTNNQYICITRPRRFGKTVNANMLGAYYTKGYDSHNLFDNLEISKTDGYLKHMNQHNVIYIDFSRMPDICMNYRDYITNIINGLKEDIFEIYPHLSEKTYSMISQLFQDTGESFIFIFDEWDSIFYENFMTKEDKIYYLKFLKGLLKDQPYVELTYMTGILPIAKYSSGSELNMFREYNFMNDQIYENYFGLNENEVRKLCEDNEKISYEELKKWYDGYHMSNGSSLFNPRSVNCAITDGVCLNYWTETGPMNEIADCIEHNIDAVREDIVKLVAGIPVKIKLKGYSVSELQLNTRNEILSAMVVYGFLSYYDGCLQIPNYELMEKYQEVLTRNSMGEVKQIVDRSREMIHATIRMDEEKVASILEEVHDKEIPFLNYNDENSLSCVVTLCYLSARDDYDIKREEKSGKGYCDYMFYPKKSNMPAIILELKVNGTCDEAITQIKEKNYVEKVKSYKEVLIVGINYDKKKHHRCKIEKLCYN
ncbi:MAG: AAA family ATPase [Lachnospiraceae bacterium]|nr:AAA family ATPase [Lachnospiraceae bacterium]